MFFRIAVSTNTIGNSLLRIALIFASEDSGLASLKSSMGSTLAFPVMVIFLPLISVAAETKDIHLAPATSSSKTTEQPTVLRWPCIYAMEKKNKTATTGKQAEDLQQQQNNTYLDTDHLVYTHPVSNNDTQYTDLLQVVTALHKKSEPEVILFLPEGSGCSGAQINSLKCTTLPKINNKTWNVSEELHVQNRTVNKAEDSSLKSILAMKAYVDATVVSLICLVALVGNILILIIFARHREMCIMSNIYIFIITVGDLLCIIINLLFFFSLFLLSNQPWNFGTYFCKLFFFASDLSVALSIFGLTALSVQRYCGILANPFVSSGSHFCFSKRMKVCHILFVCTASFLLAIRTFITADVVDGRCESVTNYEHSKIIAVGNFIIFALFPLILLAVFHSLTARYLFVCARKIPGDDSRKQIALKQAREKSARIILASTFVFFTSYVPWFLWQIIFFWGNFEEDDKRVLYSFWILYYLFFGNVCFNPLALYCISSSFRRLFQYYLCSFGRSSVSIQQGKTARRKGDVVTETSLTVLQK